MAVRADTATSENLRRFQLRKAGQQIGTPTVNAAIAASRFFFNVTLKATRPLQTCDDREQAPQSAGRAKPRRRWRASTKRRPGVKSRAPLSVGYGAGLRVSEVVTLKVIRNRQPAHDAASKARDGEIGTSCSRRNRSNCCASGGGRRGRRPDFYSGYRFRPRSFSKRSGFTSGSLSACATSRIYCRNAE